MDRELQVWYELHKFHMSCGSFQTKDLAEYLKVSTRTVQNWLKEKTRPKPEQLAQIDRYMAEQQIKKTSL